MSIKSWNAGIIRPVAVPPGGPYQESAAPGVWTLDQATFWKQQGLWPTTGNPMPITQRVFPGSFTAASSQTTYTWTVPTGVTSICAVAIGSGSAGDLSDSSGEGGRAGDLRYINNVAVTPGEVLSVVIGNGAYNDLASGYNTYIARSDSSRILEAAGGATQTSAIGLSSTIGGNIGGGNGGSGGSPTSTYAGGGGGTGGYSGDGGYGENGAAGASVVPTPGGGGAYGGGTTASRSYRGGGVNLVGIGSTGSSATFPNSSGSYGGNGAQNVPTSYNGFNNGMYGAGGGGNDSASGQPAGGGAGAVRIFYNPTGSFPSAAGDYLKRSGVTYSEIEIQVQFPRNDLAVASYFYQMTMSEMYIYDESGTNYMTSLSAVNGPTTSFSSLSGNQFGSTFSFTSTELDVIKDGIATSGSLSIDNTKGTPVSSEIVISFFIKLSTPKTIGKIAFATSSGPAFFPNYIRVVADGTQITKGDATPVPTYNYLGDSQSSYWAVEWT